MSATFRASEKRRHMLYDINKRLAVYDGNRTQGLIGPIPQHPTKALALAKESVVLLQEEDSVGMDLATAFRRASKYSLQLGLVGQAEFYAKKELEVERYCLGTETGYMKDPENAESWLMHIAYAADRDQVKIRMSGKRSKKEQKKVDKKAEEKAAKTAGKGGR